MTKITKKWNHPGANHTSEFRGFYDSWCKMLRRVGNRDGKHNTYLDVTVCERWLSYDNFFEDMYNTWFKGATLDKDSILPGNRVYCKEYCKWLTKSENSIEVNSRINSKKVKCIETGKIYNSCNEASVMLKLKKDAVRSAANPKHNQKTAGGYHFEYVEE